VARARWAQRCRRRPVAGARQGASRGLSGQGAKPAGDSGRAICRARPAGGGLGLNRGRVVLPLRSGLSFRGDAAPNDDYYISNRLTLWNDFTHEFVDPVNGDQEEQHEDRETLEAQVRYSHSVTLAGFAGKWLVGLRNRIDYNDLYRLPSEDRVLLTPAQLAAVDYPANFSEIDHVSLSDLAAFAQYTGYWLPWFRSVLGRRGLLQRLRERSRALAGRARVSLRERLSAVVRRCRPRTRLWRMERQGALRARTPASLPPASPGCTSIRSSRSPRASP
jgi:hypothetical protein